MKAILEPVSPSPNQSFRYEVFEQAAFDYPWHYHPKWELTYIASSSGLRSVGNSIEAYQPGELTLLGPDLPHCWKSQPQEPARSVFIQWDDTVLGAGWVQQPEFAQVQRLLVDSKFGLIFEKSAALEAGKAMEAMATQSPLERLLALVSLLGKLSSEHYRFLSIGAHFDIDQAASERITKVIAFVETHYAQKIYAEQLAELVFMAPVSFSKFFSKTFNKTFTAYLNEYRISRACALLQTTADTVDEIAEQTGFQNLSFFHRQFKGLTQQTPLQYRKAFHASATGARF